MDAKTNDDIKPCKGCHGCCRCTCYDNEIKPEKKREYTTHDDTSEDESYEDVIDENLAEIDEIVDWILEATKFVWNSTITKYNSNILTGMDQISVSKFYEFILNNSPLAKKIIAERTYAIKEFNKYKKEQELIASKT